MGVKKLTDLEVHTLAQNLILNVYKVVERFPEHEKFNLCSQVRRSASSVAGNIAEGFGSYYYKTNQRFCRIARGSLEETRSWLLQANKLGYINTAEYESLCNEIKNISVKLNNYIKSIGPWDNIKQ